MKHGKVLINVAALLFVVLLLFFTASPVNAQDKPPKDNIIDGELYPHGSICYMEFTLNRVLLIWVD